MNFPIAVLAAVFVAIAFRQVGRLRLRIWQAMGVGALAVLLSGDISPADALRAIDLDVMLFLFGMFVVGDALVESGYLYTVAYHVLAGTRRPDGLVLAVLFGAGFASALLMNDTLAIVGTPLVLRLAREHRLDPRLLLLTLAFAVTTGGVMSPIGNPQNLLIAVGGDIANPFVTFLSHLFVPTVLSLLAAYGVLRLAFRESFHARPLVHERAGPGDPALARLARLSLGLGEVAAEDGPFSRLTVNVDESVVLLHDPVGRCQAQARPFPRVLRGEEGLEHLVQDLRRHAGSRIHDGHLRIPARLGSGIPRST